MARLSRSISAPSPSKRRRWAPSTRWSPPTSTTWPNLYRVGATSEAEPLFKRSLAVPPKALGPEHPDVAVSLNNLALLYRPQGRYGEGEPLAQRALAIGEKALGPDHADVAEC